MDWHDEAPSARASSKFSSRSTEELRALPEAIRRALELVWENLGFRARLFLLEGDSLVLKECMGSYRVCPEIGLRVHPQSVL